MDFTYLAPPEDAHRVAHTGILKSFIDKITTSNMGREKRHQGKYMRE